MFQGSYRIADKVFRLNSLYDEVQQLCRDYATTDAVDYE